LSGFKLYGASSKTARLSCPHCLSALNLQSSSCSAASASAVPTALVSRLLVSHRPIRPQLHRSLGFGMILRPSWPRSWSAFDLYGSCCSSASASADPTAFVPTLLVSPRPTRPSLLVSLRLIRPQLLGSLGFGRLHGPRDLAACQPSAYTALASPKPRLRHYSTDTVALLLVRLRPIRSKLHRSLGLNLILRPSWPRCLSAVGPHDHSFSTASALADPTALVPSLLIDIRPVRPQLHRSLDFGLIIWPSRPRCLSAFGQYGPSCTAASASALFYGHRGLAACQPSVYTALATRQPRLRPTPRPS